MFGRSSGATGGSAADVSCFKDCPHCETPFWYKMYDAHVARCQRVLANSSDDDGDGAPCSDGESYHQGGSGAGSAGSQAGSGGVSGSALGDQEEPERAVDPGLLEEHERIRRLQRWALQHPNFDPRVRFGAFNWSQMLTVIEARMSEKMARAHLERLHARGCGKLGLTLKTRLDVSTALRSLLDDNPANSVMAACEVATGEEALPETGLHFFEETIHVWNGKNGAESDKVPRKLIMRELTPVVLAMFLDPWAYGRQRTRYHAPTVDGSSERIYSDPLSSNAFARAEASAPGKQVCSFDGFYDETVIESCGKRFKPCARPTAPPRTCVHDSAMEAHVPHGLNPTLRHTLIGAPGTLLSTITSLPRRSSSLTTGGY